MSQDVVLRLTGRQKQELLNHLFPGDGLEAIALLICGRRNGKDRHCLSVMDVVPIPHGQCQRTEDTLTWPTELLEQLLNRARAHGLAVVKVHSHPGGFDRFSAVDDRSDAEFFSVAASWSETAAPHGSVVLLPCGRMFGRYRTENEMMVPIDLISVAGEIVEYWANDLEQYVPDFADRHAQVLGEGTFGRLRRLCRAVVGCSGTGSPTVEQLFRLGVGEIVLIDPDFIGHENLNRIINSRGWHASQRTKKVDVLANSIVETDLGTTVHALDKDLCEPSVIEAVASCDVIFGCVDSVFARHVLNKLASTYCIPYIDIGVGIKADGKGGIAHATGAVHYLQPDGSSLLSRQVFNMNDVQSDVLRRTDPREYESRLDAGYIKGADIARPTVMPINLIFSGYGVYEFLCRIHPIRDEGNREYAAQRWSLTNGIIMHDADCERCGVVSRNLGRGDMVPLLGMPELSFSTEPQNVNR